MSQQGSRDQTGASASGSGRREGDPGGGGCDISRGLTYSAAKGAAQKLARLKEQAEKGDAVPPDKRQV